MTKYEWTNDMGEISGFGGSYEADCRAMVIAGAKWLEAWLEKNSLREKNSLLDELRFRTEAAEALSKVIGEAVDGPTGAMHHAVVFQCLFIARHGWDGYVEERRRASAFMRSLDDSIERT